MLKGRRRWLALGALAAVLVVGSGAAIAAERAGDDGFLAGVARRLGITEDRLTDAIRAETLARIDQAEKDGDLTEEQADRLREHARSGETPWPFPGKVLPAKPLDAFGLGFGLPGRIFGGAMNQFEAAADYLGVTEAQLREELEDGDSLADVAREKGRSVDGLKTALKNALKKDLDEAVADDAITREQADDLYEKLSASIDTLVENGFRLPKIEGGFGFGFGFGFGKGNQFEAAATYLGVTEAQLREELEDGDSLADVAREKGRSVDGLKTALKNALKKDLDEAVADDAITREQADDLYEKLSGAVDELVEREGGRFGFRLELGPGGPDFGFERGSRVPGILPAIPEVAVHVETDVSLA
jgi:lambda repressor-like predicted transcriptional regulator